MTTTATVKCPLGGARVDLADGRALAPGESAAGVDIDAERNRALLAERRLLVIPAPDPRPTIAAVLSRVGDDRDAAVAALAAEREHGDPRPRLVKKLESIITKQEDPAP